MSNRRLVSAFTLIEVMTAVAVIAVLASVVTFTATSIQKSSRDSARNAKVQVISDALEKYYRKNGEYPSVALMTSTNANTVKQKLNIANPDNLKFPNSTTDNSIVTSGPSTTKLVYAANTTDNTKNTQCQTDANGYCDGFSLQYVKEAGGGTETVVSLHSTFVAVSNAATCNQGDTQNGSTCTHTYTASYQNGTYNCPNGGTLSGTTCTSTYSASYYSSGYYTCPNGGTLSGSTCTVEYTGTLSQQGHYYCPNGGTLVSGPQCVKSASSTTSYTCPHQNDNAPTGDLCVHNRTSYTTKSACENAGYYWQSGSCYSYHSATSSTTYYCSSGWTLSGTSCFAPAAYTGDTYSCPNGGSTTTLGGSTCRYTYAATYNSTGGYYCPSGGSLSGTTCTTSYSASQTSGYYYCPNGGTVSGATCTYTYSIEG